jgi:hypothetical protein
MRQIQSTFNLKPMSLRRAATTPNGSSRWSLNAKAKKPHPKPRMINGGEHMDTTSYWIKSTTLPRFHKVDDNYEVDVAVVGGGIAGVTAAYLLKRAGYKVALLERGRCGGFDGSNTTAHLTCVTDTRLHTLASKLGIAADRRLQEGGGLPTAATSADCRFIHNAAPPWCSPWWRDGPGCSRPTTRRR